MLGGAEAGTSRRVRIALVNVNGIRAAVRKGMTAWLEAADVDILTLQEVRATADDLAAALPGWYVSCEIALAKGRAGVAIASRIEPLSARPGIGDGSVDLTGRWIEADFAFGGELLTAVSAYVPSGEADSPRQDVKWLFLDEMAARMPHLAAATPFAVVTGDLNVGHREIDIRNWKGNLKRAGFLPRERAYFDRWLGERDASLTCVDGSLGTGSGWVDIGRRFHGETDGPYTWWSNRGQAFDNNTGWRIDYHLTTGPLAERATGYHVARAPSWDTRWSDHAPVVADYEFGR
jgi:exodeoxyribonuclease III